MTELCQFFTQYCAFWLALLVKTKSVFLLRTEPDFSVHICMVAKHIDNKLKSRVDDTSINNQHPIKPWPTSPHKCDHVNKGPFY